MYEEVAQSGIKWVKSSEWWCRQDVDGRVHA